MGSDVEGGGDRAVRSLMPLRLEQGERVLQEFHPDTRKTTIIGLSLIAAWGAALLLLGGNVWLLLLAGIAALASPLSIRHAVTDRYVRTVSFGIPKRVSLASIGSIEVAKWGIFLFPEGHRMVTLGPFADPGAVAGAIASHIERARGSAPTVEPA